MMSPTACIFAARSNAVSAAQALAASRAAAIAARASSRSPCGTVAITSPVAGLVVSAVAPVRAARPPPARPPPPRPLPPAPPPPPPPPPPPLAAHEHLDLRPRRAHPPALRLA